VVRFEDVVGSYDEFVGQLLEPLGLSLPLEVWRQETARPKNISKDYGFPSWKAWTNQQKMQFHEICGETNTLLGYSTGKD